MKLSILKSKTEKIGENYLKTEYTLETETLNLEIDRQVLEQKIDGWLNVKTPKQSQPQTKTKVAGKCADCGKPSGKYYRCFDCNQKWKE